MSLKCKFAAIPSSHGIERASPSSILCQGSLTLPLWVTPFCSRPPVHLFKVNLLCLASGGFEMWWQTTCLPRCPLPAEDSWSPCYPLAYSHPWLACRFTTTQLCTVFLRMTTGTNFLVLDRALSRPLLQEAFLKFCFSCWSHPSQRSSCIHKLAFCN